MAENVHGGAGLFESNVADQRLILAIVIRLHIQEEHFRIQLPAFLNFLTSIRS